MAVSRTNVHRTIRAYPPLAEISETGTGDGPRYGLKTDKYYANLAACPHVPVIYFIRRLFPLSFLNDSHFSQHFQAKLHGNRVAVVCRPPSILLPDFPTAQNCDTIQAKAQEPRGKGRGAACK